MVSGQVLESRYNVPPHVHFSQSIVPALYERVQAAVVQELSTGQSLPVQWSITDICVIYFFLLTICQYLSAFTVQ